MSRGGGLWGTVRGMEGPQGLEGDLGGTLRVWGCPRVKREGRGGGGKSLGPGGVLGLGRGSLRAWGCPRVEGGDAGGGSPCAPPHH